MSMSPEVSRACAALKNELNLGPGQPQYDQLVEAASQAQTIEELPRWIRTGLKKMGYKP